MTIQEAISGVDSLQPNTFTREEKLAWLCRVEAMVKAQILDCYADAPEVSPYTPDTDPETTLLVGAPWEELYLRYLQAQMDLANGETTRYANSAALYNSLFNGYRNHYNRTHMAVSTGWKYF